MNLIWDNFHIKTPNIHLLVGDLAHFYYSILPNFVNKVYFDD